MALAIVMGLARLLGDRWWILAAPAFVGLVALFAFVMPYLVPTHRLDDPALRADVQRLEEREDLDSVRVVVQDVSSDTSLPNAEAMGLGASRRIVLWDTLVHGFPQARGAGRDRARARLHLARPRPQVDRLVHALRVPQCVPDRAIRAPARRYDAPGGSAVLAARARRPRARGEPAPERDHAAHGGGGRV